MEKALEEVGAIAPKEVVQVSPEKVEKMATKEVAQIAPEEVMEIRPEEGVEIALDEVMEIPSTEVVEIAPEEVVSIANEEVVEMAPEEIVEIPPVEVPAVAPKEGVEVVSEPPLGCSHYQRKCQFVAPCCNKPYVCRVCHDDAENHEIDRQKVKEVICLVCKQKQSVQSTCQNCKAIFGKYCCLECNLFDDRDKGQFHCKRCGICRIGGAENFFHCEVCNMCLHIQISKTHKCIENLSRSDCPVCLEDLHTSRVQVEMPACSHLLHRQCLQKLIDSGFGRCPVCKAQLKLVKGKKLETSN